jgi:hypothetical protein
MSLKNKRYFALFCHIFFVLTDIPKRAGLKFRKGGGLNSFPSGWKRIEMRNEVDFRKIKTEREE